MKKLLRSAFLRRCLGLPMGHLIPGGPGSWLELGSLGLVIPRGVFGSK